MADYAVYMDLYDIYTNPEPKKLNVENCRNVISLMQIFNEWQTYSIHSTYVCTYIHTYIHTYVRTYVRTYIHTYIHTCVSCTYAQSHIRTVMVGLMLKFSEIKVLYIIIIVLNNKPFFGLLQDHVTCLH